MADLSQAMTEDPSKYREELFGRLDALRRKETFCDVTVAVNGKEFKAHKVVLAAVSPFFLSLWESNMIERNEQLMKITLEEATASVMEDVLQYIYTGNVSVTEERCHKLIATADYLVLPGLKSLACDVLKNKLAIDNCVFNYYFADKYHCAKLKRKCCKKICSNFTAVMETEDFLNLEMSQVIEWVSSDDIKVKAEEEVFKGIVKWVCHNRSERESCFPDLLRQVRLKSVSQEFLLKELVKEDLITTNIDCLNFVMGSMESIFIAADESLMKAPRNCLKVLLEGIFVCGGKHAFCYLPHDNEWYDMYMANLRFEHQHHAVIQYRDKVYIFSKQGVVNEDNGAHVAEYYAPSANSWGSIQTNFSFSDEEPTTVSVVNGFSSLYAVIELDCESGVFAYKHDTKKWELQRKDLRNLVDRWGTLGVADKHHLYIIGGTYYGNFSAEGVTTVERFNPTDKQLEEVASLNEPRHGAFGAAMNDKIYVAGGIEESEELISRVLNTCEVYNPSTNEWHLIANLCVPRHSASMVCFSGVLYVIGGLKNATNQVEARELSVEQFDTETSKWKVKCTIPVVHENEEERIHYKACFATIHKDALEMRIDSLWINSENVLQ